MKLANIVFSAVALMLLSEMPLAQNKNRSIDEVIAVVDTSLVTKLELENRVALIEKQFKAANRALPPADDLKAQVLERLISERIQQNLAKEAGIKVSDKDLDRILGNIAAQSKLSVAELKLKVEKEGANFNKYKEEIRKEVQAARLREREVDARVQVSESEIDSYISEKNRGKVLQAGNDEIYLAQLVVALPVNASESDVLAAKNKAEDVLKQASVEKDFLAYGKKIALPGSGVRVEDLGYRTLDRLPQLFVDGAQGVGSNQMIPRVLQSGAGFHIIKVIDRKGTLAANVQNIVVTQTQARHILLRHRPGVTDLEAQRRLNGFRDQIKVKASDFALLAKKHSEDGSAPNGGNLGWMSPGELVPEFEQAMNQLNINEVSDPVRTEFGWHLIQVVERRQAQLSADKQRDYARAAIREKKMDQAYQDWLRQIRDAATVEIRQSN
ncbi:peptidylprolyl isomerase [Polynucleobacter sp. AM-26B4]|uniref:peptidylprolyl isomerase n=1 Tax=Polynucleobacter sp. AM-26B4 TaxID=2689103 RepID=UPI001C0C4EE6|nr:peptidylprolyl isomerase [Polynucleobacter sp. AM-26B4]MBU3585609.1 peptidylprolyl isomerase [Polynucleobacter sp. AM-26B4]